jgi:hypothetical protein
VRADVIDPCAAPGDVVSALEGLGEHRHVARGESLEPVS